MGMEVSAARARRWGRDRRREEDRWRSLNGPVVVTKLADRETDTPGNGCDESHQMVEAGPNRLRGAPEAGQDGATVRREQLYRV